MKLNPLQLLDNDETDENEEPPEEATRVADEDALFTALSNDRRRNVVDVIDENRSGLSLRKLSREVAGREAGKPTVQVSSAEYRRVYIPLYQSHLDTLTGVRVIDPVADSSDTVRPGPAFDSAVAALEAVRDLCNGGEA